MFGWTHIQQNEWAWCWIQSTWCISTAYGRPQHCGRCAKVPLVCMSCFGLRQSHDLQKLQELMWLLSRSSLPYLHLESSVWMLFEESCSPSNVSLWLEMNIFYFCEVNQTETWVKHYACISIVWVSGSKWTPICKWSHWVNQTETWFHGLNVPFNTKMFVIPLTLSSAMWLELNPTESPWWHKDPLMEIQMNRNIEIILQTLWWERKIHRWHRKWIENDLQDNLSLKNFNKIFQFSIFFYLFSFPFSPSFANCLFSISLENPWVLTNSILMCYSKNFKEMSMKSLHPTYFQNKNTMAVGSRNKVWLESYHQGLASMAANW